jgi:hypothetical protein
MIITLKATNENLPPNVIRQLAKELKNLDESPPEGITVIVNDDDFTTICADIEGPGNIISITFCLLQPNVQHSYSDCAFYCSVYSWLLLSFHYCLVLCRTFVWTLLIKCVLPA